ncbi:MAG: HAD-IIB family hydrolase, partial [Defluviitaleaceae bacterium]|nr:HAD-IIB family hydrolase [Defluviitaleaceae bacterium]
MKYKLIAVDMDGTLLNGESVITEATKTAILQAIDADVVFVVSTGRPMRGVENVNALFSQDMPFIVFNGAAVVMGKSRKVLFNKYLDLTSAKEIFEAGTSRNLPVVLWTGERLWANRKCDTTRKYQQISGAEMTVIDSIEEPDGDISKIVWIGAAEEISKLQHEMSVLLGTAVNCHTSRPEFLEFVSGEADKGSAMAEIGKVYGIDKSEMIAIGDGY